MGRLSRRARERRRRAGALVAQRAAAAALLPRATAARRAAAAALGARRRDRDRARGRARLRRDADATAPGRVADPPALGRDPGRVRRLRPAALGRRAGLAAPLEERRAELERVARASGSRRARRPRRRARLARAVRGARARRRRRQAARAAVPARLARGHGQGQGAQDGRLRRRRHPLEGRRRTIATLLLGLYRDDGEIDYVGSCAVAARRARRGRGARAAAARGRPDRALLGAEPLGHAASSRRRAFRPELVVEVRYDKVQGNRFRHGTKLLRWPDKEPAHCTWQELRPPRRPDDPTFEALVS